MAQPRLSHVCFPFILIVATTSLFLITQKVVRADDPRVQVAYTAWDDYFFYAAFEVNDHNVISTNRTPISQPQEDDDVEVYFDTNPAPASNVRTTDTYEMAVSAGSGSYFSVGDGTKIAKGKLVLTYKYAVTIDGTLNDPSDNDTGFTVELAIPWQEIGLAGPPSSGQTFGFNAISRNRESLDTPSQSFVSLSPEVASRDDIQNPSKWTKIQFITTLANQASSPSLVYCPRVTSDTDYPIIDGVIRSGEWNTNFGLSFGQTLIAGAAPTKDEEPNITDSPFATAIQPVIQTPTAAQQPTTTTAPPATGYTLSLPGGGEIHVGTLVTPPPAPIEPTVPMEGSGRHKFPKYPGSDINPLAPNLPSDIDADNPIGPTIDPNATLSLTEQKDVSPLILAPYFFSYPAMSAPLLDQPIDGLGPAFGGNHAQWNKDQLTDARNAGIDVVLPVVDPTDPQSETGLASLVEALKELKSDGQDYPLLGVKVAGDNAIAAVREFLTIVPAEFRSEVVLPDAELNQRAYIVVADTLPDAAAIKKLISTEFNSPDTALLTTPAGGNDYLHIVSVSPGGIQADGSQVDRQDTHTLAAAWEKVYSGSPNWVYVNSWNDYLHGTEIAASRQYGEQYVDFTRAAGLRWSGADQWDAKYLQNDAPTVIAPKTIYTVSVRVENNGSLPWRAGEGYALCFRWYKDGRLYDDSAPRLPLTYDVYPGQSATLKIGVVAQNSFGKDIDPGAYTLVFDIVQGQNRWFSYVGSRPLRVPVRVEDTIDSPQAKAEVVSSTTPSILSADGTYSVSIFVRNDGQEVWTPTNSTVTLEGNRADAKGAFDAPVYPGAIGEVKTTIRIPSDEQVGKIGDLNWTVKTPGTTTSWREHPLIVQTDLGASFAENNVPRSVKTNQSIDAKVALYNTGPFAWSKGAWKIGYEWRYLDGTPAVKESACGALEEDVPQGAETATKVSLLSPSYPGKYQLILDLQSPDGLTTLDEKTSSGGAILPMIVSVTADKNADAETVDLSKYFTANIIGNEAESDKADFDGNGDSLPGAFMPPDGTTELDVDPLLVGKSGPPEYPSGYYSSNVGAYSQSNHRIAFLFGQKGEKNAIASAGQVIELPAGPWKAIHVLSAAASDTNTVEAPFTIGYKDGDAPKSVQVANWTKIPDPTVATVALRLPYKLNSGAIAPGGPVFLGDYTLTTDSTRRVTRLTLPNDPRIKILAITVEK